VRDLNRISRRLVLLFLFILSLPAAYVLASLIPSNMETAKPKIIGTFKVNVEIINVKDLYAWQILIVYDPQKLVVMEILPGGFVGRVYPSDGASNLEDGVFMSATYTDKGMLLLGGCLCGNVLGRDGDGLLAKITFGYLSEEYEPPQIAFGNKPYETKLLDSNGNIIPIDGITWLKLS
jgi:hypothetical protein